MQFRVVVLSALILASAVSCGQYDNALYIYNYFRKKGWSPNAICGMLGNMQAESGIVADIDEYGGGGGYGLVQWTPKSKLTTWANARGLNYRALETQCARIQWELENGQQFYPSPYSRMTFRQYITSTLPAYQLAMIFNANYERPANPNQPKRGEYAINWYKTLVHICPPPYWYYTVKVGDCLSVIAAKFGVTIEAIVKRNNISNPNLIYVGQVLMIPRV